MVYDRLVGWDRVALLLAPDVMTMLDGRYFNVAGDTIAGNLSVTGTSTLNGAATVNNDLVVARTGTQALVDIRSDAGQLGLLRWSTGSSPRWSWAKNTTAESGSNAGSNLELRAFSDAGALLSTPMTVTRSTGVVAFPVSPTGPTAAANTATTQLASTAFVDQATKGASGARQTLPASELYVGGLSVAAAELTVATRYRIVLNFSNPATASTTTIRIKYGSAGTVADATIHTATFTGTAAADVASVLVDVGVDTVNVSTGTITALSALTARNLGTTATGFHNVAGAPTATTQTGSLNTTGAAVLGISIQETAATTVLLHAAIYKVTH